MELTGAYLKKSREEKKIKISSVCKILKISKEIINDIENDDFPNYLDKVYFVGHIRSYANFLNLDADLAVKNFKAQTLTVDIKKIDQIPKPLVVNNLFNLTKTVSFFSIIIITFVFYFLFINSYDLEPEFSIIPDIPENLQYVIEENEVRLAINKINKTNIKEDNNHPINKYLENDYLNDYLFDQSSKNQIDVIASSSPINELNNTSDVITLRFLNSTWIQLRDNQNQIVISKLMNKDEEFTYLIKDNYALTAGNAGNILILINQETRGKVGKKGELIESLIIHSEFNN